MKLIDLLHVLIYSENHGSNNNKLKLVQESHLLNIHSF